MSKQDKSQILGLIAIILISTASTIGTVVLDNQLSVNTKIVPSSNLVVPASATTTVPVSNDTKTNLITPSTSLQTASSFKYKDGTYSSNGAFDTPDGTERIGVGATISGDKVTRLSIDDSNINSSESAQYTRRFMNGINSMVVGRSLDSISVSRVSGASLTPMGFNRALETIKNEAKI